MSFYYYEHDPAMAVNLQSDTSHLKERQQQLQQKLAKIILDLDVVTNEIVRRSREDG